MTRTLLINNKNYVYFFTYLLAIILTLRDIQARPSTTKQYMQDLEKVRVSYQGVSTTKPLEDREFRFVYLCPLLTVT
jgi:hypothetical protein